MLENVDLLNMQAIELAAQGNYADAIVCLKRALAISDTNHLLWFNLGITYRDAGKFTQAKKALEKAFKLKDDDIDTIETLAHVNNALGDTLEALFYCEYGTNLFPENPHMWNTLGVIQFNNGNHTQACAAFEHAVTLNPYYYDALYNLRDTYDELGNQAGKAACEKNMKSISKGN